MGFVSPSDAVAYVERVDADVWRLSRAVNDKAPPLDPWVIEWKRWRTAWVAWRLGALPRVFWSTATVMDECEAREAQLAELYEAARERGWAPSGASPKPETSPGKGGVLPSAPQLGGLGWALLGAAVLVVVWRR